MNIVLLLILLMQSSNPPCTAANGCIGRSSQESFEKQWPKEPVDVPPGYEWGTAELADPVDVPPIREDYADVGTKSVILVPARSLRAMKSLSGWSASSSPHTCNLLR